MRIDIISWRLRIGVFSPKTASSHCTTTLGNCAKHYAPSTKLSWVMIFLTVIFCISSLDAICMDFESNPWPHNTFYTSVFKPLQHYQTDSFVPLPLPHHYFFFCSCPSFLDEPCEETLATQASNRRKRKPRKTHQGHPTAIFGKISVRKTI